MIFRRVSSIDQGKYWVWEILRGENDEIAVVKLSTPPINALSKNMLRSLESTIKSPTIIPMIPILPLPPLQRQLSMMVHTTTVHVPPIVTSSIST